ncbi:MAG TPA: aromatic ring-hydroxylating dioxygenase subunit alpha [Acidimicrobiales bacterium]|nr:aromatic ring-hydroxylating dioxygenase subunit alpha [Acidimicrobiales bacterium]
MSEHVLRAEKERVFASSWFLVATAEELAAPGEYLATSVVGAPVIVVRGGDGQLGAFHNVCRHRGLTLVEGRGRLGRFLTCPYHQWSYRLDGALAKVPQEEEEFPGLDKSRRGLVPLALSEWHGMVFVRLSLEGPSLQTSWGALGRQLHHFCGGPLVEVARVSYEAYCNWKLLVENHVDVYHLWYLHSRSLRAYAHTRFNWQVLGDNWWSHEPLKDPAGAPGPPVALAWLDEAERTGIGAHLLFPNLMIVTTGRYFATYDAVPLTPGRTLLTLRIRAAAGTGPGPLVDDVRSFMAEDLEACRRLQEALGSPAFALGPLARHHEAPLRAFHSSLRRKLVAQTNT